MSNLPLQLFICVVLNFHLCWNINPETLATISSSTVKKCNCDEGFAINENQCIEYINPIRIWDNRDQGEITVNISDFANVVLRPLQCDAGFSKINLSLSEFIVYPNGALFNSAIESGFEITNYCLDHILDQGQNLTIVAQVCQRNPQIRWCCPLGQVTAGEECVPAAATTDLYKSIPLVGNFKWEAFEDTFRKIQCGENRIYKKEALVLPGNFQQLGASLVGYPLGSFLLYLYSYLDEPIFVTNNNYCVSIEERNNIQTYYAQFCIPDRRLDYNLACQNSTCVRKCCNPEYSYDVSYGICVPNKYNFTFNFMHNHSIPNLLELHGGPLCEEYYFINNNLNESHNAKLVFNSNGQLSFNDQNVPASDYCVDGFVNSLSTDPATYDNGILCFRSNERQTCAWRWIAGSVFMSISCIFYALTLIVYLILTDLRQRISGKCLISEVSSLLVTYLLLVFLQNSDSDSGILCNVPGALVHITILASFFWLNVMCFDMWKTITSNVPVAARRVKGASGSRKKFLLYSLYGWGIPILIGLIRVTIDELPTETYTFFPKTSLGKAHCFFSDKDRLAKWIYLYAPIAIILCVNTIFFALVAKNIIRVKKKTARIFKEINAESPVHRDHNRVRNRDKALLYLKLFLVMGLSWMMEIIMWIAVDEMDCRFCMETVQAELRSYFDRRALHVEDFRSH